MNNSNKIHVMKNTFKVLLFILLTNTALKAQTPLPVLNFESGNKNIEAGNCWAFGAFSYSNLEFRITGFWSGRSNQLTSSLTSSTWIKTPWIKPGSGNITLKSRLENSSGTSRGIVFTYIPFDAGLSSATKEGTGVVFSTYTFPTPLSITVRDITVPIPAAIANSSNPYKILISFIGNGGNSRAFVDDINIPATYFANPLNNCLPQTIIQDKDNDGISDQEDAFPEDAERAFISEIPGAGKSTLMFEDLWPSVGDFDFNDFVATYQARAITNAANKVVEVIINTQINAIGASYNNGFLIQFDNLGSNRIKGIKGNIVGKTEWVKTNDNGTEANQEFANVIIFDKANSVITSPGGSGINVNPDGPFVDPQTVEVTVEFLVEKEINTELKELTLNPYIVVNQNREIEVHLADNKPSNLANSKLFGTGGDNTNPEKESYYKTKNNLPFAIKVEEIIPHMVEKQDILTGYLKLADWAKSGGKEYQDWYKVSEEYRSQKTLIYLKGVK